MSSLSAGDGSISIAAGIIIGLLASCVQSLGLTIQRKSHVLNQALPDDLQRVEHRRPLWLLGFLIFISSNILGSLFQIASLPVVILAPLGACTLPPSRPSSPFMIRTDSVTDLTTERTPLLVRKRVPASSAASTVSVTSSTFRRKAPPLRTPLLLSISYASTSGILSGMCLIFAKSGVELLLISIHGNNQFWKWQAWMLVLGLVGFALIQLWYLHKALKLADPTIVCPLAFCFYNLSSIVNGLVYFDQVSLLPTSHLLLVTVGIIVLLGGVWAVSLQAVIVDTWSGGEDADEEGAVDEGSLLECNPSPAALIPKRLSPSAPDLTQNLGRYQPSFPLSPRRRATHHHLRQSSIGGPISSPPSSVHAPVFSIGLSPASPGFALVPRERRRGTSGQSGGNSWDEVIRRVRTRRVVSDSNVLAGEEVERGIEEAGTGGHERADSRERWAWLRRLIVGQRGVS
ncbi:hypothetical protein BJV77DRAFT_968851 [Russula vinacea]|nr:hypothetical protein BJV77DRAFT_968851 [Russula vinacea]